MVFLSTYFFDSEIEVNCFTCQRVLFIDFHMSVKSTQDSGLGSKSCKDVLCYIFLDPY